MAIKIGIFHSNRRSLILPLLFDFINFSPDLVVTRLQFGAYFSLKIGELTLQQLYILGCFLVQKSLKCKQVGLHLVHHLLLDSIEVHFRILVRDHKLGIR